MTGSSVRSGFVPPFVRKAIDAQNGGSGGGGGGGGKGEAEGPLSAKTLEMLAGVCSATALSFGYDACKQQIPVSRHSVANRGAPKTGIPCTLHTSVESVAKGAASAATTMCVQHSRCAIACAQRCVTVHMQHGMHSAAPAPACTGARRAQALTASYRRPWRRWTRRRWSWCARRSWTAAPACAPMHCQDSQNS